MRLRNVVVLGTALVAAGLVTPATAAGANKIAVSPDNPRPGERVEVRVHGCPDGQGRHWAGSPAFTSRVALDDKHGTAIVARDVRPGVYDVVARCGSRTITGDFTVSTKRSWPALLPTPLNAQVVHTPHLDR